MKKFVKNRVLRKTLILGCLVIALTIMTSNNSLNNSVEAHFAVYCDLQAQFDSMMSCSSSFGDTVDQYNGRVQQCYNLAYTACGGSPSCIATQSAICENDRTNAYNNRYPSYGNCITGQTGIFYDVDLCTAQYDPCPNARAEGDSCIAQFPYGQDTDTDTAREACLDAVPHGRAKGRDPGCPGFPIAP